MFYYHFVCNRLVTFISPTPYSPELNPVERFFEEIRRSTANTIFKTLEEQEDVIADAVKIFSADENAMKQLSGYE